MKRRLLLVIALAVPLKALAIGDFAAGVSLGYCGDPNNIEREATSYNTAIEQYRKAHSGVRNSQLTAPGAFATGINVRYQFNYILIRAGACYLKNLFETSRAEVVRPHLAIDSVGIETYQASSSFSLAMILPLRPREHLYFGGGISLIYAYYRFFQSDPGVIAGLPASARETYADSFIGWHFIMGMEFPLTEQVTLCAEWIRQGGVSSPVRSADSSSKRSFNADAGIFLAGANFYVRI